MQTPRSLHTQHCLRTYLHPRWVILFAALCHTEIKENSRANGNSLWLDSMLECCTTVYVIVDTHYKCGKYDLMTTAEYRLIIVNICMSLVCVRVCVCMSE